MEFRDSQSAFNDAIASGRLNTDQTSEMYAGKWMYMHSEEGRDFFKNIDTRKYIASYTNGIKA